MICTAPKHAQTCFTRMGNGSRTYAKNNRLEISRFV